MRRSLEDPASRAYEAALAPGNATCSEKNPYRCRRRVVAVVGVAVAVLVMGRLFAENFAEEVEVEGMKLEEPAVKKVGVVEWEQALLAGC